MRTSQVKLKFLFTQYKEAAFRTTRSLTTVTSLAGLVASILFLVSCSQPADPTVSNFQPPTVAEAEAFIDEAERSFQTRSEYENRVFWISETNITFDGDWLATQVDAERTAVGVKYANLSKRFENVRLNQNSARKLRHIKLGVNVPAPEKDGAAMELAELNTRMYSTYAVGKVAFEGQMFNLNELEDMMRTVRDPNKLAEIWTKWRQIPIAENSSATNMKLDYERVVEIANAGSAELGFDDLGAMWKSRYELEPELFESETERLWQQVKPLYDELQCHTRAKLSAYYGEDVQPPHGPIRADLLGNMWAQGWGNIYDLVAPENSDPGYDLTELLASQNYNAKKMVETGEAFFSSLGFKPLPDTFWQRSMIVQPDGREVSCHASAWNLDGKDDIRIKMCIKVNADDFQTIHHELGHNYYQRAYQNEDYLYRAGANGGFHEAIGDWIALSITPEYLHQIGLLETVPNASADIGLLLESALNKVAFLPFGLLVDKWRSQVFSGKTTPDKYNESWWSLRREYQGVMPPSERAAKYFDAGSKYHISSHTSYTRYFVARILQFQFHKAACEIAGWQGPLHRCSIYNSTAVGERLKAMLEMGASQPWPEALKTFVGKSEMDGSAMVEYYAPLMDWLYQQNKDRSCGWTED